MYRLRDQVTRVRVRSSRIAPNIYRLRNNVVQHPCVALSWCAAVLTMIVATLLESLRLGQWALLIGLIASIATGVVVLRYAVNRLTQIVALWAGDVPLDGRPLRAVDSRFPTVPTSQIDCDDGSHDTLRLVP